MSLSTFNFSASGAHFALGTFFSIYFPVMNKNNPQSQNVKNQLALQDHDFVFTGNPIVLGWKSTASVNTSLTTAQGLVIAFYYITAVFHLFYGISGAYPEKTTSLYPDMIKNQNNWLRWVEYAISSTLMIQIIALLCTVKDTNTFALLTSSNIVMIALGQMVEEKIREGKSPLVPILASFFLLLSQFGVILREYIRHVNQIQEYIQTNPNVQPIPVWIPYMFGVLFLFFSCFGVVSILQATGVIAEYENVEKTYIILSLVAKTSLGAFMAYGAGGGQQRF
jgi:hypothetical protein